MGVGNLGAYAQTFEVGLTGTLHSVDLILVAQAPGDTIRVDVRGATGGAPNLDDGNVLGSRLIAASSLPAYPSTSFLTINFVSDVIAVAAGQALAIVLIRVAGTGGAGVLWVTENSLTEDYAKGTFLQRNGGSGTAWTAFGSDFYFRTRVLVP